MYCFARNIAWHDSQEIILQMNKSWFTVNHEELLCLLYILEVVFKFCLLTGLEFFFLRTIIFINYVNLVEN